MHRLPFVHNPLPTSPEAAGTLIDVVASTVKPIVTTLATGGITYPWPTQSMPNSRFSNTRIAYCGTVPTCVARAQGLSRNDQPGLFAFSRSAQQRTSVCGAGAP